nr:RNA-dependent RNA polymerase [Rhizoctonia zeae megabirnavirus 1]
MTRRVISESNKSDKTHVDEPIITLSAHAAHVITQVSLVFGIPASDICAQPLGQANLSRPLHPSSNPNLSSSLRFYPLNRGPVHPEDAVTPVTHVYATPTICIHDFNDLPVAERDLCLLIPNYAPMDENLYAEIKHATLSHHMHPLIAQVWFLLNLPVTPDWLITRIAAAGFDADFSASALPATLPPFPSPHPSTGNLATTFVYNTEIIKRVHFNPTSASDKTAVALRALADVIRTHADPRSHPSLAPFHSFPLPASSNAYLELTESDLPAACVFLQRDYLLAEWFMTRAHVSIAVLRAILQVYYPTSEVSLDQRNSLTRGAFARLLMSDGIRSMIPIEKLAALMYQCVSQSFQMLSIALILCIIKPTYMGVFSSLAQLGYYAHGLQHAEKKLKIIHTYARKTRMLPPGAAAHWPGVGPSDLFYLNLTVGRFYDARVANDSTIEDRRHVRSPHLAYDPSEHRFTAAAHDKLMDRFFDARAIDAARAWRSSDILTLDDWLLRYPTFGAAGSAGSGSGSEFGISRTVSKRLWLSNQPADQLAKYVLEQPAMNYTRTIVKRELGKLRQLLASPISHWAVESVLLNEIESKIFRSMATISIEKSASATYDQFMDRRRSMFMGHAVACSDWADFNITHAFRDMMEYYFKLGEMAYDTCHHIKHYYGDLSKGEYLRAAAIWCAEALNHTFASNGASDDPTVYQLFQGLWSGWRSTQFINMGFNVAYSDTFDASLTALFGAPSTVLRQQTGDDGFGTFLRELDAVRWVAINQWSGHEINDIKQLAASQFGEYLRTEYFRDMGVQASLIRRVGGFLTSDLQSDEKLREPARAQGVNEVIHSFIRLGADIRRCEALRYPLIVECCRIDAGGRNATPSEAYLSASAASGGLGCARYGRAPLELHGKLIPLPTRPKAHSAGARIPLNASRLANEITDHMRAVGFAITDPRRVLDATVDAAYGGALPDENRNTLTHEWLTLMAIRVNANNVLVSSMRARDLPYLPEHFYGEAAKLCHMAIHASASMRDLGDGCSEDLNAIADGIRATALGFANSADTVVNYLAKYDERYAPVDVPALAPAEVLRMLRPDRTAKAFKLLDDHLGPRLTDALVTRKFHVPTNMFGVMPTEIRALAYLYINNGLLYYSQHVLHRSLWTAELCHDVAIRLCMIMSNTFRQMNSLIRC